MTLNTTPRLRPLGLGELLDQSIRLYRRNFLKFIGIVAVVLIPLTLLQIGYLLIFVDTAESQAEADVLPSLLSLLSPAFYASGSILIGIFGYVLTKSVSAAALTYAIASSYLGQEIGILEAYGKIGRSWVSLLGVLFLAVIFSIVLILFCWILSCVVCVVGMIGLPVLAFVWMVMLPLTAPIIVLEKQSAIRAIGRAWNLIGRRFWWVIGFALILAIFAQIIITGPIALLSWGFQLMVGNMSGLSIAQTVMQTVLQSLLQLMSSLIYLPLQLTAMTLVYFDLRIRTEGFDLVLLTESMSGSQTEVTQLVAQAPQSSQGGSVTLAQIGYFSLGLVGTVIGISVIFGVLCFVTSFIIGLLSE
jgi:hypothetical protein